MIGKFEFCQAIRGHLPEASDLDGICEVLDIDRGAMDQCILALTAELIEMGLTEEESKPFVAGVIHGILLGVKAHHAKYVVECERCGNGWMRGNPDGSDDPVPPDYSPLTHTLICSHCKLAEIASMN